MKGLKDKKPQVGKAETKRRVRMALQTQKPKDACKRMLRSLMKTAHVVIKKNGAVSDAEVTAPKDEARGQTIALGGSAPQ